MRITFYDTTKMGEGFDSNPVLSVQREQLASIDDGRPHWAALDLGCGAGTISRRLLCGARMDVIGADVSPTALAAYVDSVAEPAVRLDATALPFPDDSFDLVVSDDLVEHLVDTDEY